jgi:hypothetical protein
MESGHLWHGAYSPQSPWQHRSCQLLGGQCSRVLLSTSLAVYCLSKASISARDRFTSNSRRNSHVDRQAHKHTSRARTDSELARGHSRYRPPAAAQMRQQVHNMPESIATPASAPATPTARLRVRETVAPNLSSPNPRPMPARCNNVVAMMNPAA